MTLFVNSSTISVKNTDGSTKMEFAIGDTTYFVSKYSSRVVSTADSPYLYNDYFSSALKLNYITITDCNGNVGKQLIGKRMPFNFPILIEYEQNNVTGDVEDYEVLFPDGVYANLTGTINLLGSDVALSKPTGKFVVYTLEQYWLEKTG